MIGELFHVGFIYVLTISISVEINGKQIKSISQSNWYANYCLLVCGLEKLKYEEGSKFSKINITLTTYICQYEASLTTLCNSIHAHCLSGFPFSAFVFKCKIVVDGALKLLNLI